MWARAGWGLVACLLLGAVAFRPALRAVRPDVAAAVCGLEDCYSWLVPTADGLVDPWGTAPFLDVGTAGGFLSGVYRSAGPDRVDGTSDDIDILAVSRALGLRSWSPGSVAWVPFACRGPEFLTLAAAALTWCLAAPRPPRATLPRELARAAFLASVPAATCALALDWYLQTTWWRELDRVDLLLVPWRMAACGSVALLCGLVALAWRLRALPGPAEPPGRGDHQQRQPRQDDVDLGHAEPPGAQEHDRRDGGPEEHGRGGPHR